MVVIRDEELISAGGGRVKQTRSHLPKYNVITCDVIGSHQEKTGKSNLAVILPTCFQDFHCWVYQGRRQLLGCSSEIPAISGGKAVRYMKH